MKASRTAPSKPSKPLKRVVSVKPRVLRRDAGFAEFEPKPRSSVGRMIPGFIDYAEKKGRDSFPSLDKADPESVFAWVEALRDLYGSVAFCKIRYDDCYPEKLRHLSLDIILIAAEHRDAGKLEMDQRSKAQQIMRGIYWGELSKDAATTQEALKKIGRKKRVQIEGYIPWTETPKPEKAVVETKPEKAINKPSISWDLSAGKINIEMVKGKTGKCKYKVFGFPVTHIIRWMAFKGNEDLAVTQVLQTLKLEVPGGTIAAQCYSGRKGEKGPHGPIPKLTKDQESALSALFAKPKNQGKKNG